MTGEKSSLGFGPVEFVITRRAFPSKPAVIRHDAYEAGEDDAVRMDEGLFARPLFGKSSPAFPQPGPWIECGHRRRGRSRKALFVPCLGLIETDSKQKIRSL